MLIDSIQEILNVPEDYELIAYLPVGVAKEPCKDKVKLSFEERAWFNDFGRNAEQLEKKQRIEKSKKT